MNFKEFNIFGDALDNDNPNYSLKDIILMMVNNQNMMLDTIREQANLIRDLFNMIKNTDNRIEEISERVKANDITLWEMFPEQEIIETIADSEEERMELYKKYLCLNEDYCN